MSAIAVINGCNQVIFINTSVFFACAVSSVVNYVRAFLKTDSQSVLADMNRPVLKLKFPNRSNNYSLQNKPIGLQFLEVPITKAARFGCSDAVKTFS